MKLLQDLSEYCLLLGEQNQSEITQKGLMCCMFGASHTMGSAWAFSIPLHADPVSSVQNNRFLLYTSEVSFLSLDFSEHTLYGNNEILRSCVSLYSFWVLSYDTLSWYHIVINHCIKHLPENKTAMAIIIFALWN